MRLTDQDIEIFKALNRYRFLRLSFLKQVVGYDLDGGYFERRIGHLAKQGYIFIPDAFMTDFGNWRYSSRLYGLASNGLDALVDAGVKLSEWNDSDTQFKHRVLISDIVSSVEIGCKAKGLDF